METSLIGKALDFGSKECRFDSYVSKIKNSKLNLISNYNIAVRKKSVNIKLRYSKQNLTLLKKLHSLGIINNYLLIRNTRYIKFSPSYFCSLPYCSSIKCISRGLKSFSISSKGLNFLKQFSGNTLILLESSAGLLTLNESLQKKKSGKIMLVIN